MSTADYVSKTRALMAKIDDQLVRRKLKTLEFAHQKSGQKRVHIVLSTMTFITVILVVFTSLRFLSHLVAFVPLYRTYKALKTPQKDDDVIWLTYWVLSGSFSVLESFLRPFSSWFAIFFLIKIVFLIWAFHPTSKGSLIVFKKFVEPALSDPKMQIAFNADAQAKKP